MNNFCDKCGSILDARTGECPNCAPQRVRPVAQRNLQNGNFQTGNPQDRNLQNRNPQIRNPQDRNPQVRNPKNGNQKKPANKKTIMMAVIAVVVAFSILFGVIVGFVIGKNANKLPDSYDKIVEQYKLVMMGETAEDESLLSHILINKLKTTDNYEICYSYTDINNDKTEELIIGGRVADDEIVDTYDIFTMDSDEKAVQLLPVEEYDEDIRIDIYKEVIKVTSESEDFKSFVYYDLPKDEYELELTDEYAYDLGVYLKGEKQDKKEISKEEFEEADNKYEGEELDLEWVKIKLEEDNKNKNESKNEPTTLTDAQLASFEKMLNDMKWSRAFYSFQFENEYQRSEVDDMMYTFIFLPDMTSSLSTMYYHYFGEDYKQTIDKSGEKVKITFEYDADKILFILNDVFGYNVTQSYTSEYTHYLDKIKAYFKNNKFYIETTELAVGDLRPDYEVDSYEPAGDGYFKIKTKAVNTENGESWDDCYYIVKPEKHSKFGDYWEFKEYGLGNEVYWSRNGSNNTKPTETTTETTTEKPKSNDAEIYQEYLKNGGMDKYTREMSSTSNLEIKTCLIDMNNDGVNELLFTIADASSTGVRGYFTYSVLFGIQNDKVVTLKEFEHGGGSAGGEKLFIKYDSQNRKHVVTKGWFFGDGMRAGESGTAAYSYNGKNVSTSIELIWIFYQEPYYSNEIEEYNKKTSLYEVDGSTYSYYKENGKFVTKAQHDKSSARFQDPTDSRYKMKTGSWSNPLAL